MEEDVKEETTAAVEDTAEAATTGTTPNYRIDYSDSRFTDVEAAKNSITQARLQNNSALAQIAYQSLQQQLELALQGFQYKNQLLLDKADKKLAVENQYYTRWQDVLSQMNTENALAEQIRQYNESLAEEQRQFDYYANRSSGGGGGGGGGDSGTSNPSKPQVTAPKDDYEAVREAIVAGNKAGQLEARKNTSYASMQEKVEAARASYEKKLNK